MDIFLHDESLTRHACDSGTSLLCRYSHAELICFWFEIFLYTEEGRFEVFDNVAVIIENEIKKQNILPRKWLKSTLYGNVRQIQNALNPTVS